MSEHLPFLPLLLLRSTWGWSTGIMATPLTTALRPNQLLWPALLSFLAPWLGLDTVPMVARHLWSITFSFPQRSLTKQHLEVGSFSKSWLTSLQLELASHLELGLRQCCWWWSQYAHKQVACSNGSHLSHYLIARCICFWFFLFWRITNWLSFCGNTEAI